MKNIKKSALLFVSLMLFVQIISAQKDLKQAVDQAVAQKGANLFINADKTLLEPNESTRLSIGMLVFNDKDYIPGDTTPPLTPPDEEILPPENQLYKATNWKILEGEGNIIGIDDTTITYTAPSKFPPEKLAVISVDLVPKLPNLPKVVLIQKIYLTLNENSFVLNLPQIGAANAKYISDRETGNTIKLPKMDSQSTAKMSPAQRAAMEKAQEQLNKQKTGGGINISAVTSNAMAIYDAQNNQTAIQLTKLAQQANDGKPTGYKTGSVSVTFNFKGKGKGSYSLNDKDTGFGIRVSMLKAAGCGVHSEIDREFLCDGKINITEVTEKTISGTIRTTVWTSVGESIFRGSLYGKFTVNRAN